LQFPKGVFTMMSSIHRSLAVVAGASALFLISGALYSEAQEPARTRTGSPKISKKVAAPTVEEEEEAPAHKSAAKKKSDPRRRLYPYFGQLGLSDAQKELIYDIRAKHSARISELEKQLEDTRIQAMAEAERVLNPAQKKLLEDRRKAAHAAAEARSTRETKGAAAEAEPDATKSAPTPTAKKKRRARDN
jgi:hypothetical protein